MRHILLGLGGNLPGLWGQPIDTLQRTLVELERQGLVPISVSPLYRTSPIGGPAQATYLNAVVSVRSNLPPGGVLRTVKRLERLAGRRLSHRWGPRPLDIDILDDKGRVLGWGRVLGRGCMLGWSGRRRRRRAPVGHVVSPGLVVPHPSLHRRAFVLAPLRAVDPHWRHPVLGHTASRLLMATGPQRRSIALAPDPWPGQSAPPG